MIERYILKELGFSLYNIIDHHPHKYILYFIKLLNGNEILANYSWKCLNDSMRLDISLKYDAPIIACAAIYLASHYIGYVLPERKNDDNNNKNTGENDDDNDVLNNNSITNKDDNNDKDNNEHVIEEVHQITNAKVRANRSTSAVTTTTTTTITNDNDHDDNDDDDDDDDDVDSLVSWWEIIGTNKKEILEISEQILELYRMEKVGPIPHNYHHHYPHHHHHHYHHHHHNYLHHHLLLHHHHHHHHHQPHI